MTWTNNGPSRHTTTSDTNLWDSGSLNAGQQFQFTFNGLGTFSYHCNIHPFMTGVINVVSGCVATSTPTSAPSDTPTNTPTNTPVASTNTPTPTATCAASSHRILIVEADCGTNPTTLQNQLLALPGVSVVDVYDAFANPAPTLAQLQQYDTVVAFSNCGYSDPTTLGNNLADYEDAGGVVVGFNFDWYGGTQSISGRWSTGGYSPYNDSATVNFTTGTLGTCTVPQLCTGVNSLSDFYRESPTLVSGATSAGTWSDGTIAIAYKGHAVSVSGYVGDGAGNWSGDFAQLILNSANYLGTSPCTTPTNTPLVSNTPTFTRTSTPTPTSTPTSTPTACGGYTTSVTTANIVPGTTSIGNACDDCTVP